MSSEKKDDEAVKVVVRCRPLNATELRDGRQQIVDMDVREGQVSVRNPKLDSREAAKVFTFDQVYNWDSKQVELFNITAKPIVESVMAGYNGTIFAYGQTGTGKTFTMDGVDDAGAPHLRGITLNTFDYVFDAIGDDRDAAREYLVYITYLEIYNEEVKDLLASDGRKLKLHEDADKGVYVKDLRRVVVNSVTDLCKHLTSGKAARRTGATAMNEESSRSHSMFTVYVERKEAVAGKASVRVGKLNLVDLAGSERQSKTAAVGDRLREGININLSLTALGNVIEALVADQRAGAASRHVPYRDSKLTRLLQDSLGGNTKTVMVANIGPADWNYDETLSTLRYANRAKNITNKPKVNEDPKDTMLRGYQDEIARLKAELAARGAGGGDGGSFVGAADQVRPLHNHGLCACAGRRLAHTHTYARCAGCVRGAGRAQGPEADAQLMERLQREIKAKLQQDHSKEAMARAQAEAEAKARAQLEAIQSEGGASAGQQEEALRALAEQRKEIERYAAAVQTEMAEKAKIEARLSKLQASVMHGGDNLVDKMSELKKQTKATKAELEVKRRQHEELERRMAELARGELEFHEQVGTRKEQAEKLSSDLKKLYVTYQTKKSERDCLNEDLQAEKEEILDSIREMTREIKLKDLIIASFIPPVYQEKIMKHSHWDEYEANWVIDAMPITGNALRAQRDLVAAQKAHIQANYGEGKDTVPGVDSAYFTYKEVDELQAQQGAGTRASSLSRRKEGAQRA